MGLYQNKRIFTVLLIFSIFFASLQFGAMRPLGDLLVNEERLVFQSLQKGPVRGSGSNPCTYIPGRGSGNCKLNGMNVAGDVVRAPPAPYPVSLPTAANAQDTDLDQNQSS